MPFTVMLPVLLLPMDSPASDVMRPNSLFVMCKLLLVAPSPIVCAGCEPWMVIDDALDESAPDKSRSHAVMVIALLLLVMVMPVCTVSVPSLPVLSLSALITIGLAPAVPVLVRSSKIAIPSPASSVSAPAVAAVVRLGIQRGRGDCGGPNRFSLLCRRCSRRGTSSQRCSPRTS